MNNSALEHLVHLTRSLRDTVLAELHDGPWRSFWHDHWQFFRLRTGNTAEDDFADAVAQTVVCCAFAIHVAEPHELTPRATKWLIDQADPLLRDLISLCTPAHRDLQNSDALSALATDISRFLTSRSSGELVPDACESGPKDEIPVFFYERFLHVYDRDTRRRQGVFYTPRAIVSFIVRSVHGFLRDEFCLQEGLTDQSTWHDLLPDRSLCKCRIDSPESTPFVRILDPAMGSGTFVLGLFDVIHEQFHLARSHFGDRDKGPADGWNEFVTNSLLQRICGQELMLPPLALAQILFVIRLSRSGYRFDRPGKLRLSLANTMQPPEAADTASDDSPFTVVIGNPPFSGVSDNRHPWIEQLLRGRSQMDLREVASYFVVDGQPLNERKHWLADDYVKFMRFAHWLVEQAGTGIVAFVTNHGFLDNSTFRAMRYQLLRTFPQISIVDLHGNTRSGERPPDGRSNESVFGIEQGVSLNLFRRPPKMTGNSKVKYGELWGERISKLDQLDSGSPKSLATNTIRPRAPYYSFVPQDDAHQAEYERGFCLVDAMPINSTAAVTARDSFIIGFTEQEVRARIDLFRDLSIPDATIRERYFTRTRSPKYLPGDTRGWRLAEARRRMSQIEHYETYIQECLYRPFDRRRIFWANWMIDWPREQVMNHLIGCENVALVARRHIPSSQPCCYFWVTDTIAVDGLIRSDNRGSESIFPLFLHGEDPRPPAGGLQDECGPGPIDRACRSANFSPEFIRICEQRLARRWTPSQPNGGPDEFGANNLFHYIYALFHAPSYRQRYATWLRLDFPRIFIPQDARLFDRLAELGSILVDRHLLRGDSSAAEGTQAPSSPAVVTAGYPKYKDARIWLNRTDQFGPVAPEVWTFRVGTHQVCRKWLRDRRQQSLDTAQLAQYAAILRSIAKTLSLMKQIDHQIDRHGGWADAF